MLCLIAAGTLAPLFSAAVTLAWTHSVERIAWEEDWRSTAAGIELVEARVRGSGAGMEPPPGSRLVAGAWTWRPALPAQPAVVLRRSGATADWRICVAGTCRPMAHYLPADADPVTLTRCDGPG